MEGEGTLNEGVVCAEYFTGSAVRSSILRAHTSSRRQRSAAYYGRSSKLRHFVLCPTGEVQSAFRQCFPRPRYARASVLDFLKFALQDTASAGGLPLTISRDDIDIACDELYYNGKTIQTPFDGLIAFSDATSIWGLNESTLRKAIAYGKLINGQDVCKFGKQWVISIEAMKRVYGMPKA